MSEFLSTPQLQRAYLARLAAASDRPAYWKQRLGMQSTAGTPAPAGESATMTYETKTEYWEAGVMTTDLTPRGQSALTFTSPFTPEAGRTWGQEEFYRQMKESQDRLTRSMGIAGEWLEPRAGAPPPRPDLDPQDMRIGLVHWVSVPWTLQLSSHPPLVNRDAPLPGKLPLDWFAPSVHEQVAAWQTVQESDFVPTAPPLTSADSSTVKYSFVPLYSHRYTGPTVSIRQDWTIGQEYQVIVSQMVKVEDLSEESEGPGALMRTTTYSLSSEQMRALQALPVTQQLQGLIDVDLVNAVLSPIDPRGPPTGC